MSDKTRKSYIFNRNFYDDVITQRKWWSRLYSKFIWKGGTDKEISEKILDWIPDDFSGKLLDVPVGTAVFTTAKYMRLKKADIYCLDYSNDMLDRAEYRFSQAGLENVRAINGDVRKLPFKDETFDIVLCMNGFHVFPDKDKAYSEIHRCLKPGGELLSCFYVAGEYKFPDWFAKNVMARMGWFTPPFDTAADVKGRLEPHYEIKEFKVEGSSLYFRAIKRT